MERKWTYFISSTLRDLREQRKAVANLVLKLDEIPIGMEQFGAIDTVQWEWIKKLIDTADYYVLIVAGRYGAIDTSTPDGLSFTEKEFRYAREKGVPIIAILHDKPGSLGFDDSEPTPEGRAKLEAFRTEVQTGRLVSYYNDMAELIQEVATGIAKGKLIFPRPGWVRNVSTLPTGEDSEELLTVKNELETVRRELTHKNNELNRLHHRAQVTDDEQEGTGGAYYARIMIDDRLNAECSVKVLLSSSDRADLIDFDTSWSTLFVWLSTTLFYSSASTSHLRRKIAEKIIASVDQDAVELEGDPSVTAKDFEKIEIVFESLGLVRRNLSGDLTLTRRGRKMFIDREAEKILPKSHPF